MNISGEDIAKTVFGAVVAALVAAVGWLTSKVLGNRESVVKMEERLGVLEQDIRHLQTNQLTRESVREVIEDILAKRDQEALNRRKEWDEKLTLQIRQSVMQGVQECQTFTRTELERMVPLIVRDVLQQSGKHERKKSS